MARYCAVWLTRVKRNIQCICLRWQLSHAPRPLSHQSCQLLGASQFPTDWIWETPNISKDTCALYRHRIDTARCMEAALQPLLTQLALLLLLPRRDSPAMCIPTGQLIVLYDTIASDRESGIYWVTYKHSLPMLALTGNAWNPQASSRCDHWKQPIELGFGLLYHSFCSNLVTFCHWKLRFYCYRRLNWVWV